MLSASSSPHYPYYSLILYCGEYMSRIPVQHIFREANQCADRLAALGHSLSADFADFVYIPLGAYSVL
ncbi:hypothetical protein SLE2022_003490 [Rubroshorea leprosula]